MGHPAREAVIFDVQRQSVHDGPGLRTTIFFKGCPLRCRWCQNPESQSPRHELLRYLDRCLNCHACAEACPQCHDGSLNAASLLDDCTLCGACAAVCPVTARTLAGRVAPLEELVQAALRDQPFYGADGGVTLSGGEPLRQWPVAFRLADTLRAEGVQVAIDTSGFAHEAVIRAVPTRFDLVIADLKAVTPAIHRRWTGVGNEDILEAIRFWATIMPGQLWLSVPLIPGVHDAAELTAMAGFLAELDGAPPVRLIPHHQLGDAKYSALGREQPPFAGDVAALAALAAELFTLAGIRLLPA